MTFYYFSIRPRIKVEIKI